MGFTWLGSHKAHHENHSCDLPPSCFLPCTGICFWPVMMAWATLPACVLNRVFVTPWTAGHQTPLSLGFSRQEYWSGLLFPSPGNLLDDALMKPGPPALAGGFFTTSASWEKRVTAPKFIFLYATRRKRMGKLK